MRQKWLNSLILAACIVLALITFSTQRAFAAPPNGTLIKSMNSVKVYQIDAGRRRWIPNPTTFECMGFNWGDIHTISDQALQAIPAGPTYPSRTNETLLKGKDARVYVMQNCKRHWIPNPATFNAHGYKWNEIQQISDDDLFAIPEGPSLPPV